MSIQAQHAGPARATPAPAFAIEARELVKTYPKGVRALDGLTFTVQAGTIFGLLGPNGAGKSTTVKILTTLARPDSGVATVAGLDVSGQAAQVRRAIGVVAQRSGADPTATGRENLLLSGRIQGLRGRELSRRAGQLLDRFELGSAAARMVRTYSGGMRRRLDVAMGLIHRPEVLFLDEPTAGLDPESRSAMWAEIARLSAGEGLTILLTTHYLEEADRLASRLAIVDRGRVAAAGTPDELEKAGCAGTRCRSSWPPRATQSGSPPSWARSRACARSAQPGCGSAPGRTTGPRRCRSCSPPWNRPRSGCTG